MPPHGSSLSTSAAVNRPQGFDPVVHGLLIGFLAALAVIPIEIRSLFGLPAHPLLLHAPVVLIPLLGIAAIALVIRRDWLARYGVALAIGAIVTLGATNLAVGAGEAFREARDNAMTSSTLTAPAGESGETGESGEPGEAPSGEEERTSSSTSTPSSAISCAS